MAFLDFEKAFDRVNWAFRDAIMEKMGFPPSFISAIRGLYHNCSNSLLINSTQSRLITQTRGVRQGCPLSPFLFALFAEPLGLLLRSLEGHGNDRPVCGVRLPSRSGEGGVSRYIVASQFADDTTVYASTAEGLKYTLSLIQSEFCLASGAKLNANKTRTLCSGGAPAPAFEWISTPTMSSPSLESLAMPEAPFPNTSPPPSQVWSHGKQWTSCSSKGTIQ